MAFTAQEGAEPIPGYQLLGRLGTGGFGEVWKCTAPGGLTKAIKIVYGHMKDTRADQELKALNRIKEVRHPFLLSLERFEIIDGQLFIITELADMSLLDRFVNYQQSGLPGIPREELLGYIRDAADVLDYLREHHDLQHLDIKPQNLLLVGGRIKVADFGLVKQLHATSVTATGGVTPVYAPPEAFDGRVTLFSDQYSLAIVYQEMLTGVRPFPGTTALQLAAQHASSPPMLDPLPVQDRAAIARGLSKIPEHRYPSCKELVKSLLTQAAPAAWTDTPTPGPMEAPAPPADPAPSEPGVPSSTAQREQLLSLDTETSLKPVKIRPASHPQLPVTPKPTPEKMTMLRPTLFLGVGGLAGAALRRLKQRIREDFPDLADASVLRWLYLDTDRQSLNRVLEGPPGETLEPSETLYLPLYPPEHYREQSKDLLRWLERRWLYGIPRSLHTEGIRPLGRLALVESLDSVLERVRESLGQMCSAEAKQRTVATTGLPLRDETPRIFLVASITGGSGSGMFLDLAYAVRQMLAEHNLATQGLCGMLLFATPPRPADRELARLNAWSALQELQHFSRPDVAYPGEPDRGLKALGPENSPFQDCYYVQLGDQINEADALSATGLVTDYLYLDTVTPAGLFLDRHRANTFGLPNRPEEDTFLRTMGMADIRFPRRQLARSMAGLICKNLIDGWRGDTRAERGLPTPSCARELEADSLVEKLKASVQTAWGVEPFTYLRNMLSSGQPVDLTSPDAKKRVLQRIDALFASSDDDAETANSGPGALLRTQQQQQKGLVVAITSWLVSLVESPGKRLRAADRGTRWLQGHLATAIKITQDQLAQQTSRTNALRMQTLTPDSGSGVRWLGFRKQPGAAADPTLLPAHYGLSVLEVKALEKAEEILSGVAKHLASWILSLGEANRRLNEFDNIMRPFLAVRDQELPAAGQSSARILLPGESAHLSKAAAEVFRRQGEDWLRTFDERLQAEILESAGGLWGILSGSPDLLGDLAANLQAASLEASLQALQDVDAAALYLEKHVDKEKIHQDLVDTLHRAAPACDAPQEWRHLLVGVPSSPAGVTLINIVFAVLKDFPITTFEKQSNVILCQEGAHVSLQKVAQFLASSREDAASTVEHLVSRRDVAWGHLVEPRNT